jgi:acetyltransferase-like isoleucine patch superfamily enzyme
MSIGSNSVVLPGVILTDGCSIGAMSLVNKSVHTQDVMAGIPIKKIKERKLNIFDLENKL